MLACYICGRDETRRDETRRDETRRDETRRDETRRDETRRDETRRDETRRDDCIYQGLVAALIVLSESLMKPVHETFENIVLEYHYNTRIHH